MCELNDLKGSSLLNVFFFYTCRKSSYYLSVHVFFFSLLRLRLLLRLLSFSYFFMNLIINFNENHLEITSLSFLEYLDSCKDRSQPTLWFQYWTILLWSWSRGPSYRLVSQYGTLSHIFQLAHSLGDWDPNCSSWLLKDLEICHFLDWLQLTIFSLFVRQLRL